MPIYPLSAAERRSTDAGLMLAQRLRRCTNINQALVQIKAKICCVSRRYLYILAYLGSRHTISGSRVIFTLMRETDPISLQPH